MSDEDPVITIQEVTDGFEGHSIRVAARKTGLSVDTLRMWERRYGFPTPARNEVNNRVYSVDDIERLALIAKAMKLGWRAGEAIRLPKLSLTELLMKTPLAEREGGLGRRSDLEQLMEKIHATDPAGLAKAMRRAAKCLGASDFVTTLASPLAEWVGESWSNGGLALHQEHLFTEVLSFELKVLASELAPPQGPELLLATLTREQHGLGLDMLAVMAQLYGARAHSLGVSLPCIELAKAASSIRPEAVAISVATGAPPAAVRDQLEQLAAQLPSTVELWLGGKGVSQLEDLPSQAKLLRSWEDLELAVTSLIQGR